MFIVLHCGGMAFNGDTIKTKSLGGSETAAYYMAKELASRGHRVTMFTNTREEGKFDEVNYVFMGECNEQFPLGNRFHQYAESTPHDTLIVQRNYTGFNRTYASKMNLLWMHDVATSEQADMVQNMMWNVDGILAVSEWHREQIIKTYSIDPEFVHVVHNAVDGELFKGDIELKNLIHDDPQCPTFKLFYSSRPERGLEYLVAQGGVMDVLKQIDSITQYELYVCGYDHVAPQMVGLYNYLWGRMKELGNCHNLGALSKKQLADTMRQMQLHVYPSAFRETFCITAVEAMHAELPFLGTAIGALPGIATLEGTQRSGCEFYVPESAVGNGGSEHLQGFGELTQKDVQNFAKKIVKIAQGQVHMYQQKLRQQEAKSWYSWTKSAAQLEAVAHSIFKKASVDSVCQHLLRTSDIIALEKYLDVHTDSVGKNVIASTIKQEVSDLYTFSFDPKKVQEHYTRYYQSIIARGEDPYARADVSGNSRFEVVAHHLRSLEGVERVLDYGCYNGHYSIALAKLFPEKVFVGVDFDEGAIQAARKWAEDLKLTNVSFEVADFNGGYLGTFGEFDCIIVAEVLEHVRDPKHLMRSLETEAAHPGTHFIITTPYGPWEKESYEKEHPFRFHLHHFERADHNDMFGGFDQFTIRCVPSGVSRLGDSLGSFVVSFKLSEGKDIETTMGEINYIRKFSQLSPRQTLTVCMIVRNAENSIIRCLKSVADVADIVQICIDNTTTDSTEKLIKEFAATNLWPKILLTYIESPLKTGFDVARNTSIEDAQTDWICWIDADEFFNKKGSFVPRFLRHNHLNGYAVRQQHFSTEPMGVIKTDMPVRIFRNGKGVKFIGCVHEHPEIEMNKGVGNVILMHPVDIIHDGYEDEATRRKRFARNVSLMAKDRQTNPKRAIGKFLWVRDLSLLCQFEMEQSGGAITQEIVNYAQEGIALWQDLLNDAINGEPGSHERYVVESVQYYSVLNNFLKQGIDVNMKLSIDNAGAALERGVAVGGRFANQDDVMTFTRLLVSERFKYFGTNKLIEVFNDMDKISRSIVEKAKNK